MPRHRLNAARRAFTLVEVALSLGIVSFAFITILALLPLGLASNRNSLDESRAMNLLQTIIADRKATPLTAKSAVYQLPALSTLTTTTTGKLYLAADGSSSTSLVTGTSLYLVNYTIYPGPKSYAYYPPNPLPNPPTYTVYVPVGSYQPTLIYFVVTWPAAAPSTATLSRVETLATFAP